jgi:hypothetical protein
VERELYGREAIFADDGLAARLTGLTPYGSARVAYEHHDDPPVAGSPADFLDLLAMVSKAPAGPIGPTGHQALTDGQVIVAHDAMALAVHAIRQPTGQDSRLPQLVDVGEQWPRVKSSLKVSGAGGWLCLDNHGNPYNKAVPVVELAPEDAVQRFVAIAWPEGGPPDPKCLPPASAR